MLARFISRYLPPVYVLAFLGVILGGFFEGIFGDTLPCPLCMLIRYFMFMAILPIVWLMWTRRKEEVPKGHAVTAWGLAAFSSVGGAITAGRQMLLHTQKGDPGYAGTVFGLHTYTWAFVVFVIAVLGSLVALMCVDEYKRLDRKRLPSVIMAIVLLTVVANLVYVFLEAGFHWSLPDDPQCYLLFEEC
ncbi:disulfide bond formation protein B [Salininema proteolyticum]|uniref:Disulfide bond formation protein B n=1 Tax=Salininema proteolyticum TaxID=1607685 RepID=A0ABV8TWB8_9ACTN